MKPRPTDGWSASSLTQTRREQGDRRNTARIVAVGISSVLHRSGPASIAWTTQYWKRKVLARRNSTPPIQVGARSRTCNRWHLIRFAAAGVFVGWRKPRTEWEGLACASVVSQGRLVMHDDTLTLTTAALAAA